MSIDADIRFLIDNANDVARRFGQPPLNAPERRSIADGYWSRRRVPFIASDYAGTHWVPQPYDSNDGVPMS